MYTDQEIARLLIEKKYLPKNYRKKLELKLKRGHFERDLILPGEDGTEFKILLRQSTENALDFSIILMCPRDNPGKPTFRLRRYNGRSHEHTNKIEKVRFYDYHIHTATERYQQRPGSQEDDYAEPTDRYTGINGALDCLLEDCNFISCSETTTDIEGQTLLDFQEEGDE